jgi:hypothetical protein
MARAWFVAHARRRILAAFLLCVVAGLTVAIVTSQARSGADCETVEGTLVERQVGADPLRTRGRLKGDIRRAIRLRPDQCGSLAEPRRASFRWTLGG